MEPTTSHRTAGVVGNLASFAKQACTDKSTPAEAVLPPRIGSADCADMEAITARLADAIAHADNPDEFVVLRLADLRQMDAWGLTIRGETLYRYFDLGSIDDVDQRYPVTLNEARLLRDAMEALIRQTCPPTGPRLRWLRAA